MKDWNKDLILYRIKRSRETLEEAQILADSNRWNTCVNRLYYACFYAVSALLLLDGLSSRKHSGIRSLFNRYYVKEGKVSKSMARIYNDLFERRQEGDYMDFVVFKKSQVLPWISLAASFVEHIITLIENKMNDV